MKGVEAQLGPLQEIPAEFCAISCDAPEALRKLASDLKLTLTLLSDPQLETVTAFGARTSKGHLKARSYPRKAFLQPSVIIYTEPGKGPAFKWVMRPSFFNLFGAARRMAPEEIVKEARALARADLSKD